jgi:hypothetical protein
MSSHACTNCFDAGYIKCLYRKSKQSKLPDCKDEMAIQDLLEFNSATASGYNRNGYAWNGLDLAPEDRPLNSWSSCTHKVNRETVEITENTLDGRSTFNMAFYHRLTLIQGP